MSQLDRLGYETRPITKTVKPFESWKTSPVKDWTVTLRLANVGDLIDISKFTSNTGPLEGSYLSKVYLLAKCLESINNHPVVTSEDIEKYNKDHNLSGFQKIDIFDYKVMFIRKWTEPILNRLAFVYDEVQDEYLANHLGKELPPDMKAAVDSVNLANTYPPEKEASDVGDPKTPKDS